MSMVVRSNINSMNANRNLGINNSQVAKAIEKLASGYAINRAADDASGLAITEKMQAQITGLDQGTDNALEGIGLVQTAEGAMSEIHDMLNRIVELSTKSANGTIQDEVDREAVQAEVDVLVDEIDRIAQSTNYNGIDLLNGNLSDGGLVIKTNTYTDVILGDTVIIPTGELELLPITLEYFDFGFGDEIAGINFNDLTGDDLIGSSMVIEYYYGGTQLTEPYYRTITINFTDDYDSADIKENGYWIDLDANSTSVDFEFSMYLESNFPASETIKSFILDLSPEFPAGGADPVGYDTIFFETENDNLSSSYPGNGKNTNTNNGYIIDKNYVGSAYYQKILGIHIESPIMEEQVTTDTNTLTSTEVYNGDGLILHVADQNQSYNKIEVFIDSMRVSALGIENLDVCSQESAGVAINIVKAAINYVSTNRCNVGALQNRLEHTINGNNSTSENMTSAKSRIKDADMAKEMTEYTKMNVLTQASQAMLAQSNQSTQQVLSLLG